MCFFGGGSSSGGGGNYSTPQTSAATEEKKETAKAKSRLLETSGGNKGAELNAQQGQSVRRIFG